jgi:diapolycopene oxygenase
MSGAEHRKSVIVIGAGLGGMSAAIMLARAGFQVTLLEKNAHVGGKLNQLQTKGFSFDLGPSIFTLPEIFRPVFEGDGRRLEDYVTLQRVDPQWRNFFEDGVVVDLWEDPERMHTELERFGPQVFGEYKDFLAYSRRQYEILERGYLRHGFDTLFQFFRFYGWKEARDLDYVRSMSGSIYNRLSNRYLRDIFEYFIKYVGSSALDSPAFMNLMPTIQMDFGLWYVAGGLYQLGHAFRRRLEETGVTLCLEHEVQRIEYSGSTATGVQFRDSKGDLRTLAADFVVSNMEVIPAMQRLLRSPASVMKKLRRFEPSCSGIVLHLGLDVCIRSSPITISFILQISTNTFGAFFATRSSRTIQPYMSSLLPAAILPRRRPDATTSSSCLTFRHSMSATSTRKKITSLSKNSV